MPGLDRFNALPDAQARQELAECCAARRFAAAVAAARPYPTEEALRETADKALTDLDWADVGEALAAHPRIGERAAVAGREATWSQAEQSAAAAGAADIKEQIRDGNVAYEQRFGHVFLICAAGRPAEEILADLRARLDNDPATEQQVVREELRKIVHVRLGKVLDA